MSAFTPLRAKLKLLRTPCSVAAVTTTSLDQNARGWRKVPTTRYSVNARPEGVSGGIVRVACLPMEAQSRVQVDRAVASTDIATTDVEEPARGELDLGRALHRWAPLPAATWFASRTAAITDRRHRRLVDGDEHVLPVAAAVAQLRDANAAEQAERAERPLTLVTVFAPERCAGPQLHLVQDDARIGVRIADDQDVVDDCLRSLLNGKRHVGARPIVREDRCDDDVG